MGKRLKKRGPQLPASLSVRFEKQNEAGTGDKSPLSPTEEAAQNAIQLRSPTATSPKIKMKRGPAIAAPLDFTLKKEPLETFASVAEILAAAKITVSNARSESLANSPSPTASETRMKPKKSFSKSPSLDFELKKEPPDTFAKVAVKKRTDPLEAKKKPKKFLGKSQDQGFTLNKTLETIDPFVALKTALLDTLDDFLKKNTEIKISQDISAIVTQGQDAHNKGVAAAEKMRQDISNTTSGNVNDLARIVISTKINGGRPEYDHCLQACTALCTEAQNKLAAGARMKTP